MAYLLVLHWFWKGVLSLILDTARGWKGIIEWRIVGGILFFIYTALSLVIKEGRCMHKAGSNSHRLHQSNSQPGHVIPGLSRALWPSLWSLTLRCSQILLSGMNLGRGPFAIYWIRLQQALSLRSDLKYGSMCQGLGMSCQRHAVPSHIVSDEDGSMPLDWTFWNLYAEMLE